MRVCISSSSSPMAHGNTKHAEEKENANKHNTSADGMIPETCVPTCGTHCAMLATNTSDTTLTTSRRQHSKQPECHMEDNGIGELGIQLKGQDYQARFTRRKGHLVGGSQCFGAEDQGEGQESWSVYQEHARLTHKIPHEKGSIRR
jgi:hypothetical protein